MFPRIRLVAVAAALVLSAAGGFAAPRDRAIAQNAPDYQALPLTRSAQNHLIVRASINGKMALLGVDTGAPISAINRSRRGRLR